MMARNSRREKIAITPRRSVALYALRSKVIVSYILAIVLAAGCVYLPYLCCKAGERLATRNSAGPVLLPSRDRENQCLRTYGRANRRQTTRRCLGLALQRTRHQRRPALQHSTTEAGHLPCHRIEVSSDRGEDSK